MPDDQEIKIVELEEATLSFLWQCECRANSTRVRVVVPQLHAWADAAQKACLGNEVSIRDEILPETFDALTGRYPFFEHRRGSRALETLKNSETYAASTERGRKCFGRGSRPECRDASASREPTG
jgi:hypothetical protein